MQHAKASHLSAVIPCNLIPDDYDIDNELGGDNLTQHVYGTAVVQTGGRNKYVMNNMTMQVDHMDLSKTDTVKSIADYTVQSTNNQLAKWKEEMENYPEIAKAPRAEIMIGCGCDGSQPRH